MPLSYSGETLHQVQRLLQTYGLRPKKGLGQNFLVGGGALRRIVEAAELTRNDVVVEVGPGLGTLTRLLAERAGRVIAVEIDTRLVQILKETLSDLENVTVVEGDILKLDLRTLIAGALRQATARPLETDTLHPFIRCTSVDSVDLPYKVVANLPYYITSAVLRHFLEAELRPRLLVVTVQKEVAERIVAGPGKMSLLAVSVQFYGRPRLVTRIPAGAFYPAPKVDSAVVRIDVEAAPRVAVDDADAFFAMVRAGFGQRRKMLRNSLAHGLGLATEQVTGAMQRAGLDLKQRAENLGLEEWEKLYRELKRSPSPSETP